MTDLPSWLPDYLSNPKLNTIGPRFKLRGSCADPMTARSDFTAVILFYWPPGYILSRASIEAEHSRGGRLCWEVVWLKEEVAERRYQDKQAARMSRFTHTNEEGT